MLPTGNMFNIYHRHLPRIKASYVLSGVVVFFGLAQLSRVPLDLSDATVAIL